MGIIIHQGHHLQRQFSITELAKKNKTSDRAWVCLILVASRIYTHYSRVCISTMAATDIENNGSRIFHLMMIIPAGLLLLLLSLISLGTMADTNRKFTDELRESNTDGDCVLFAEGRKGTVHFSEGKQCEFAIAGTAVLAVLSFVFGIVLLLKAIAGINVVSVFALVELVLSASGTVWAFIVSVVITAGLDETCKAFVDANSDLKNIPCCTYYWSETGDIKDGTFFYEGINASRITAWFAMGVLLCLTLLYAIILLVFCVKGSSSQSSSTGTTVVKTTAVSSSASEMKYPH